MSTLLSFKNPCLVKALTDLGCNYPHSIYVSPLIEDNTKFAFLIGFLSKMVLEDDPRNQYGKQLWDAVHVNAHNKYFSTLATNSSPSDLDSARNGLSLLYELIGADGNISKKAARIIEIRETVSKNEMAFTGLAKLVWKNMDMLTKESLPWFSCIIIEFDEEGDNRSYNTSTYSTFSKICDDQHDPIVILKPNANSALSPSKKEKGAILAFRVRVNSILGNAFRLAKIRLEQPAVSYQKYSYLLASFNISFNSAAENRPLDIFQEIIKYLQQVSAAISVKLFIKDRNTKQTKEAVLGGLENAVDKCKDAQNLVNNLNPLFSYSEYKYLEEECILLKEELRYVENDLVLLKASIGKNDFSVATQILSDLSIQLAECGHTLKNVVKLREDLAKDESKLTCQEFMRCHYCPQKNTLPVLDRLLGKAIVNYMPLIRTEASHHQCQLCGKPENLMVYHKIHRFCESCVDKLTEGKEDGLRGVECPIVGCKEKMDPNVLNEFRKQSTTLKVLHTEKHNRTLGSKKKHDKSLSPSLIRANVSFTTKGSEETKAIVNLSPSQSSLSIHLKNGSSESGFTKQIKKSKNETNRKCNETDLANLEKGLMKFYRCQIGNHLLEQCSPYERFAYCLYCDPKTTNLTKLNKEEDVIVKVCRLCGARRRGHTQKECVNKIIEIIQNKENEACICRNCCQILGPDNKNAECFICGETPKRDMQVENIESIEQLLKDKLLDYPGLGIINP